MLARRLPTTLPKMSLDEALETTKIHSVAGRCRSVSRLWRGGRFARRIHTISDAGLIGGGSYPRPGEVQPRARRRVVSGRVARVPQERCSRCCASR